MPATGLFIDFQMWQANNRNFNAIENGGATHGITGRKINAGNSG